jgi:hypothetical protein
MFHGESAPWTALEDEQLFHNSLIWGRHGNVSPKAGHQKCRPGKKIAGTKLSAGGWMIPEEILPRFFRFFCDLNEVCRSQRFQGLRNEVITKDIIRRMSKPNPPWKELFFETLAITVEFGSLQKVIEAHWVERSFLMQLQLTENLLENIFEIEQWVKKAIDDFLLVYFIVCNKIQSQSLIHPEKNTVNKHRFISLLPIICNRLSHSINPALENHSQFRSRNSLQKFSNTFQYFFGLAEASASESSLDPPE